MNSYVSIFKIVLHGRSAGKILLATILSFTFSIAVILCTFGLMDGFDHLLKSGLRHSSGDILITNRKGFFEVTPATEQVLSTVGPIAVAPVIQTEAFALHESMSKGVLVRGVEDQNFSEATGLKISVPHESIMIGIELAKQLQVQVGDSIALTFARGNEAGADLPMIQLFKISGLVNHGIYQKDLRFVYLNRQDLAELLGVGSRVNLVILATEPTNIPLANLDGIRRDQQKLKSEFGPEFNIKPFWNEYDFLIEAVRVEKFSISLILQLIVVVAVFNIIAFVIYIMEKKAQEFFFLRAVGLSASNIGRFWFGTVLIMWAIACAGAHLLSLVFNWCLQHVSFLQIPGEIYVLSSLNIKLDLNAYVTVYSISLLWILLAALFGYIRMKKQPIIQGLRQEFSS